MQFKHWFLVVICLSLPFVCYFLFSLPRQRQATEKRRQALNLIQRRFIPVLISLTAEDPLKCFATLKEWVIEFGFTEQELGHSLPELAELASIAHENKLMEVASAIDRVHVRLVSARNHPEMFVTVCAWASMVSALWTEYEKLRDEHDRLFLRRPLISEDSLEHQRTQAWGNHRPVHLY